MSKKRILLFLGMLMLCVVNVNAETIELKPMPSSGTELNIFRIVNSSGETVSGVDITFHRESARGGCTGMKFRSTVSENDWSSVDLEKNMNVWYVESNSVPEGYQKIECTAVTFDETTKSAEIPIYKETETSMSNEMVGICYQDWRRVINPDDCIGDNWEQCEYVKKDECGNNCTGGCIGGVKYAIYLNGNCSGTPYKTGVTKRDFVSTAHLKEDKYLGDTSNMPLYATSMAKSYISVPTNMKLSIKPYEYPTDYLEALEKDGVVSDKFYCTSFEVEPRISKYASILAYMVFDPPKTLMFGAEIFGKYVGRDGKTYYVEEGTDDSNNNAPTNETQKEEKNSLNFANFYIDGDMISSKMDVFLENNRTYISIKDLCYYMDCQYEKDGDDIKLKFDLDSDGIKNLAGMQNKISQVKDKVKYVVTHTIGSKDYTAYLEIKNYKSFALKSPTFDSETVDVTSIERDGKVYLPLRFVSEALGRYVEYEPAKDGELPSITISSMGTGDFYDKYSVFISFNKYNIGDKVEYDVLYDDISLDGKTLYAYGLKKDGEIINNIDKTIFVPISVDSEDNLSFDDSEKNIYNSDITYNNFILKNNTIKYKNNNRFNSELFAAISNINGYPFIEIIEIS